MKQFLIGSNSYEKVKTFNYLGSLLTNQNSIQEEIQCRIKAGNSYYSVQTLLSSRFRSKNNISSCAIWLWKIVSYIKGGMQAKGIWKQVRKIVSYIKGGMQAKGIRKQDPELNIWAQEGWEWSGWLNLEDWDGPGM